MPLIIDGGRVPPRWAERKGLPAVESVERCPTQAECIRIAFINNMPDPALEDTEIQFFELLDAVAADIPVFLKLHSLSGVPRGERGQQHLNSFYFDTDDLLNSRFDGVIMTGTEPRQPNLCNEPYWSALANVLDWAESNTVSTILSCLAAHAGVLHSDGIDRHPLGDKQFGVFDFTKSARPPANRWYRRAGTFPAFSVERSAGGCAGWMWLPGADSIDRGWSGLVREEEKAEPVRTFPGAPGVWQPDSAERIPERYKEISQEGTRDVSLDADGLFRCSSRETSDRVSRCCFVGSARRTHGKVS